MSPRDTCPRSSLLDPRGSRSAGPEAVGSSPRCGRRAPGARSGHRHCHVTEFADWSAPVEQAICTLARAPGASAFVAPARHVSNGWPAVLLPRETPRLTNARATRSVILRHPLVVGGLVAVISGVVASLLIPAVTRSCQDRPRELALKRDLVERVSKASADAFARANGSGSRSRRPSKAG